SVIYNGVSLKDFDNVQPHWHPKPYVLGIGRFVLQKGFDTLIKACEPHDLILAGAGPEEEALRLIAPPNVHFVGRADRARAVSLFKGCAMFVLPSRHEPQGIVTLEAMAAGRPVIATRVGGVPEIVENHGLLVPAGDPVALKEAITTLMNDPDLSARLAAAGRQRAEQFDWNAVTDQYEALYRDVKIPA
ncbi:MAG TPA: glycosyltransferase family 4 protein, partial [Candidatus Xenobia bacterium]